MALVIKMENKNPEQKLFDLLLTSKDDILLRTKLMVGPPVKFTLGFYNVAAQFSNANGASVTLGVNLPVSITSLIKGGVTSDQVMLCRKEVVSLLEEIIKDTGYFGAAPPTDPEAKIPLPPISDEALAAMFAQPDPEKMTLSQVMDAKAKAKKAANLSKQKSLKAPVPLRQATELLQPVKGTSEGSVYKVVGLAPNARMAMREMNGKLSVRVEGELKDVDRANLANFGFNQNGGSGAEEYWSIHLNIGSVPVQRVVGAVLMGTGLDFEEVIPKTKGVV